MSVNTWRQNVKHFYFPVDNVIFEVYTNHWRLPLSWNRTWAFRNVHWNLFGGGVRMGDIYEVLAKNYRDRTWCYGKSCNSFLVAVCYLVAAVFNYDMVDFRKRRL